MLSKRFGACGNPITGYPDGTYSRLVKLGWLRALVLDLGTWQAMYDGVPTETNIAAVITGQSGPLGNDFWSDGWRERYTSFVTEFCERFYKKVRLIEFANEWDFWNNSDRAEKAAELAIIGTEVCKSYGILGMLGSVASGDWQAELAKAIRVVDAADKRLGYASIHGFCFHPYMSYVQRDRGNDSFVVPGNGMEPAGGWERLSDKVRRAIEIAGHRTCALTELGIKVGDAGGLDKQSLYVHGAFEDELAQFTPDEVIMATYFCWQDQNGSPGERGDAAFGLIGEGGELRPAYHAASYQYKTAPVVDLPVARLLAASRAPIAEPMVETPEAPNTNFGGGQEPSNPQSDPGTQPTPVARLQRVLSPAEAHAIRWRAIVPTAPYNHDFGFERHWRMIENSWWGSPITEGEYTLDDGRPVRVFANAVIAYSGSDDTIEVL